METKLIMQPLIAMLILTIVMAIWMLLTRIPAMLLLKIHPQKGQNSNELKKLLPQDCG